MNNECQAKLYKFRFLYYCSDSECLSSVPQYVLVLFTLLGEFHHVNPHYMYNIILQPVKEWTM